MLRYALWAGLALSISFSALAASGEFQLEYRVQWGIPSLVALLQIGPLMSKAIACKAQPYQKALYPFYDFDKNELSGQIIDGAYLPQQFSSD